MSLPSGVTDVFCPACALRAALARGKEPGEGTFLRWFLQLTGRKAEAESPLASDGSEWKESSPMATAAPAPGEVIGDYEILEKIGGNLGLVFKARHRLLDKVVALKLLPADWMADPVRLARFHREIRVMGQLEHPNLVTAADARFVGDWHLVAMQLIDGVDLQQLVRTQGPFSIPVACEAARQAALGLQYAHEHGLIHRDIKPSNLMITRSGTIKVIDMGLALTGDETTAHLTQTGLVLGTMSYCAPEQFDDASSVDIRADIYSLGCTLYHLLTGKAPYSQRRTFGELVKAHQNEPFPILVNARPEAPASLEDLLSRMIAKDREARFSTPREVVEALEPFARGSDLKRLLPPRTQRDPTPQGTPVKATRGPKGPSAASGEQPRKSPWARIAIAALLVLLLTVAAFLFMNHDPVVVLMDTTAPGGIYDTNNIGGSNTTEVRKALEDMGLVPPLKLYYESIDSNWGGESRVRSQRPDLVIIHRSSFFHPLNAVLSLGRPPFTNSLDREKFKAGYDLAEDKLISFMGYVASHVPRTHFLVYSRGTDPQWTNDFWRTNTWIKFVEDRYPELNGRMTPMVIPRGYNGSFRQPETRVLLGSNVTAILKLPKKAK